MPSRLIWQVGILFHLPRAFLDVPLFHAYFAGRFVELDKKTLAMTFLNYVQSFLRLIHQISLLTLTLVTSAEEDYSVHEAAFVSFCISGFLHMPLMIWLIRVTDVDHRGLKTLHRRVLCFLSYVITFVISMYLFFRHNSYCEPYMYSYYAGVEYIVVLSNIAFYTSPSSDFPDLQLVLTSAAHKSD